MHLLDTDTMTHLYAGHSRVAHNLQVLPDTEVGTTIITKIELLRGRFEFVLKAANGEELLKAQSWLLRTEELLAQVRIVSFDDAAINEFEKLRNVTRLRKIGRADLLVASIALANKATLVTRNLRHFRQVPQLRIVNWVD